MAKAKKHKCTNGSRAASKRPGALAVLYKLDEGTLKGDAVRGVLASMGIAVKTACADNLGDPVGKLVGMAGFRSGGPPFTGVAPHVEFMLLSGFAPGQTDALLAALREAHAQVDCKAMVTQFNRLWPFYKLIEHVSAEHAQLSGGPDKPRELDKSSGANES